MMAFDRLHAFALEHREELMLAEFEKGVAFALVELFEAEDILIKRDRLLDVADFDRDVIAAIDLDAHGFVWWVVKVATCFARATISWPSASPSMKRAGMPLQADLRADERAGEAGARHVLTAAIDGVEHRALEVAGKSRGEIVGAGQDEIDRARHAVDERDFPRRFDADVGIARGFDDPRRQQQARRAKRKPNDGLSVSAAAMEVFATNGITPLPTSSMSLPMICSSKGSPRMSAASTQANATLCCATSESVCVSRQLSSAWLAAAVGIEGVARREQADALGRLGGVSIAAHFTPRLSLADARLPDLPKGMIRVAARTAERIAVELRQQFLIEPAREVGFVVSCRARRASGAAAS